ncbi:MAG: universal stress protein [Gammaproteobacteria bacterium]|nr:universal stress protein [Gammaproteobacteria bacterium]NNC56481.1 universal stress protein [Woeseiaceae bacterium]NNL51607.1 universal stress protein [Woeseiaceae bacterium]
MRVILVPVADRPECAIALRAAFDLGKRIGASVSGCHIRPHRHPEVSLSMVFADAIWRRQSTKTASKHARTLYEQVAAQNGYDFIRRARVSPGAMWTERVGSPGIVLSIVGPVSDLIVVSRPAKRGGVADMFMNAALLDSRCPVLILPKGGRKTVGKNVCIAWNQSFEAMKAVKAALPILQQAESVTIVSCGKEDHIGPKSSQLAAYLTHWGIKSKRVKTRGRDVEAELRASYKEAGADLLIAGAYSRNRWREKIFGGMTEHLIRKSRMPVLMRHQ